MATPVASSDRKVQPSRLWGLAAAAGFAWVVGYAVNGSFWDYVVMSTPTLVIDGDVKTTGRVPSVQELADLLTGAPA